MKKFLISIVVVAMSLSVGYFGGIFLLSKYKFNKVKNTEPVQIQQAGVVATYQRNDFAWGATLRPYALTREGETLNQDDLEQQFKFIKDLFPNNPCIRVNIEKDTKTNDLVVELAQKYNVKLYFVLEDIKDFNQKTDYQKEALNFLEQIIPRYKGKVAYYQLSNELSGVVFSKPEDKGEKIDAGYGLSMDKNRYDNTYIYVKTMSDYIRQHDPEAQIIISGHWVLINPILKFINDGVDVDIVGWNWGSGLSNEPGVKLIDQYGEMNLPEIVADLGKEFWIVEANRDDGSMYGKDKEQADYIKMLSQKAYSNPKVKGYFHFLLTDTVETGTVGQLGLIKIKNNKFYSYKKAYSELKKVAGT